MNSTKQLQGVFKSVYSQLVEHCIRRKKAKMKQEDLIPFVSINKALT